MRIRLDSPTNTTFIEVTELKDAVMYEGQLFRHDQSQFDNWSDPTTYSLSMTADQLEELARFKVEFNFDPQGPDDFYGEAYTLAFDALHNVGVDSETASRIASGIAQQMTGT